MADERRRHERKAMQDRAVIHRQAEALDAAHSTVYCTTVDISPAGLQLKLKHRRLHLSQRKTSEW